MDAAPSSIDKRIERLKTELVEGSRQLSPERRAQIASRGTKWTRDQDAILIRMRDAGNTFGMIAAELGVTRNAAIGRALRIKLPRRLPDQPRLGDKRRRPRGFADTRLARAIAARAPELEQTPTSEVASHAYGQPCGLLDLLPGGCRWPTTENAPHLFCNAQQVDGLPYCPDHCRVSYAPTRPVNVHPATR